MPKIFLSYRRKDPVPNWNVKRIGKLCEECGFDEVFVDRDTGVIPHGSNYREEIEKAIAASDVVLVLIGEKWVSLMKEKWDDPNDMVQEEIRMSLELRKTVVPIFLGGTMPGIVDLPKAIRNFHYKNGLAINEDEQMKTELSPLLSGLLRDLFEPRERMLNLAPGVEKAFSQIPAGDFFREGCQVTISKSFWIAKFPVTQDEWTAIMRYNPSYFKGAGGTAPVEGITWVDTQKFFERIDGAFRLPTEAEWEYACRAGTLGDYNVERVHLAELGWYSDNSGGTTHPVGEKKPNYWGLHDMHGNVREWCQDWFEESLPQINTTDPTGPQTGMGHVYKGGDWHSSARTCRSLNRYGNIPRERLLRRHGFRPVASSTF